MNYIETYEYWLKDCFFDEDTQKELLNIKGCDTEIKERFYKNLEFGTGGLRGIIGAGTNRINVYTISKATQGLADYINELYKNDNEKSVAIGYDSRLMSKEFAETSALVLNANGIKTYIFNELKPTPMVSYAIRKLKCNAGIVITASHNPAKYNGYKVYSMDGGQITFPYDKQIIEFVNNVSSFKNIKKLDKETAIKKGLFNIIKDEVEESYIKEVLSQIVNKDLIEEISNKVKIVYTPIHGSGNKPVRKVLEKAGFKNLYIVKEQEQPDSKFSTVKYPNPEEPEVFKLGIEMSKNLDADIIIGTDPDADRVGICIKNKKGDFQVLNGNEIGILLTEYVLSQKFEKNMLNEKSTVISTIVSSNLTKEIAKKYNVKYLNVLTGFKYVGEKIKNFKETGSNEFVFGFEESFGYLTGTYARDKDAVSSTLLLCEMLCFYKKKNMDFFDALDDIYKKYGYYKETSKYIVLEGLDGLEKINKIMEYFRANPPSDINGIKVNLFTDYKTGEILNKETNEISKTNLPKSNVLYFDLNNDFWFCIRPSGTEPKLKIYFGVKGISNEDANISLENLTSGVMSKIKCI